MAIRTDLGARWLRILAILLLSLAPGTAAAIPEGLIQGTLVTSGQWEGGAFWTDSKSDIYCSSAGNDGAHALVVQLWHDGGLDLYLANRNWTVSQKSKISVTLRLDDGTWRRASAEGMDTGFFISLGKDQPFLRGLEKSRTLTVTGQGGDVVFDLRGTGAGPVLRALEPCLIRYAGIDATGRPVAGSGAVGNPIEGSGKASGNSGVGENPFAPVSPAPVSPAPVSPAPAHAGSTGGGMLPPADRAVVSALLEAAGFPSPDFTIEDGMLLWGSRDASLTGMALRSLDRSAETLQRVLKDFAQECGKSSQVSYDKVETNRYGPLYSGRVSCLRKAQVLYFVHAARSDGMLFIATLAHDPQLAWGARINEALRTLLLAR